MTDLTLIVVIFHRVRPHRLTPRAALLPLALLAVAGISKRAEGVSTHAPHPPRH